MGGRMIEAPPEETRPALVAVPQLSETAIRDRAGSAFDAAVNYLLAHQLHQAPSRGELQRLQAFVDVEVGFVRPPPERATQEQLDRYRVNLIDAINRALGKFSDDPENADSTIKLYYDITRSAGWVTLSRGNVGIDWQILGDGLREAFSEIRTEFVDKLALFADQEKADATVNLSYIANFRPELAQALSERLSEEVGNRIPVSMSYNSAAKLIEIAAIDRTPERNVGDATTRDQQTSGVQE